ncbi:MAG TPA: hypothetical protein VFQ79_19415 [Bryobacteraceae bacterium]|nr:hypothetical protein [Bryobacteraceae bacterium]
MKLFIWAVSVLLVTPAFTQTNRWFDQTLGQVKEYLQLTDGQVQTILANNDEYNQWSIGKQNRIWQVQSEIVEETAKDPLSVDALGIRYAEIEMICRQMKEQANQYQTRNVDILDQNQKARLKTLEDALRLVSVISQAQSSNLAGEITTAPAFFTSTTTGTSGTVLGGIIGNATGCILPFPAAFSGSRVPAPASTTGQVVFALP